MQQFFERFVAWLGSTPFALWVGASTDRIAWLFVVHLFGLVLLLGSVIFLTLRLTNLVRLRTSPQAVARSVLPFTTAGLILMVVSGSVIFSGGAVAYFAGPWFRLKMVLLLIAAAFHFFVFWPLSRAEVQRVTAPVYALTAVVALLIWLSVAFAGRAIAFF